MSDWSGSRPPRPIFFGLALITIGAVFLMRELGIVPDIGGWTLVWLALGTWLLLGTLAGNRKGWFWPLTLLLIGTFMLLRDLEVLERDFSIWPTSTAGACCSAMSRPCLRNVFSTWVARSSLLTKR